MPKVQLETKYTYSAGEFSTIFTLAGANPPTSLWRVSDFTDYNTWATSRVPKLLYPALPLLGTRHNERIGNKIQVTSIRFLITLEMSFRLSCISTGCPFFGGVYDRETNPYAWTLDTSNEGSIPKRWVKLRFMCVQFDDGMSMYPKDIILWFKQTFLQYTLDPANANTYQRNVSVHSHVLHMTTDYTGRFNILFDKCLTLYNNAPQLTVDYTIPINKTFSFDENTPAE